MHAVGFLLASFEGLQAARQRLNGTGSSRETAVLFMAGLAIAAFWAGLYLWDRRRRPAEAVNHATGLFGELCRIHGLSKEERALLQKAASDLPNPAVAFIEPMILDRFGNSHTADAGACEGIRQRLFGS
ncbi:MAG: hypothetical protein M3552_15140 [Planctomycetota bacterium]|nr:hypothetical protein [Planctomycetaceae bacterium]MDQ3331965.1 hypothetical protein [Planctomycetota bacterium]